MKQEGVFHLIEVTVPVVHANDAADGARTVV